MLDPRAAERTIHDLTRLIEEQGFETPEEVEEYARGFVERGEIPITTRKPTSNGRWRSSSNAAILATHA